VGKFLIAVVMPVFLVFCPSDCEAVEEILGGCLGHKGLHAPIRVVLWGTSRVLRAATMYFERIVHIGSEVCGEPEGDSSRVMIGVIGR
jgi:hypothetical protein